MKKILVSGGPVHAYLDAVKIITNHFRGGLMAKLVNNLMAYDVEVIYVCAPYLGIPLPVQNDRLQVVEHKGFTDYQRIVLELAPEMDGVILGAAVANLIPLKPLVGKFPSHKYKPGDVIPIDFTIAPRIIDAVKIVAPKTQLFGFKLLSSVPHDELIGAAYDIVIHSGATAVFANDEKSLRQKFAVTKERGVHPVEQDNLAAYLWEMLNDAYYHTESLNNEPTPAEAAARARELIKKFYVHFVPVETGMIFGTVAVRHNSGFVTTGRGKRELESLVFVNEVDHVRKVVRVTGELKASLNAPLLARLFDNQSVDSIVHFHEQLPSLPTYPYAPAGTTRDTERPNNTSFNIAEHGCILLFDKNGELL